jgi:hypothetical protein
MRFVHALVPFVFPRQVGTMIQESPSKFFPTASGISGRVTRRTTTFEMASLGIALQESLEPVFHIFSDNKDIWTQDTHYAYVTFLLWAQKFETARLYIELYEDNEKVHEDCLLYYGDFPM